MEKHLAVWIHHIQDHVKRGYIKCIPLKEQEADIITRLPLYQTFSKLRKILRDRKFESGTRVLLKENLCETYCDGTGLGKNCSNL